MRTYKIRNNRYKIVWNEHNFLKYVDIDYVKLFSFSLLCAIVYIDDINLFISRSKVYCIFLTFYSQHI